MLLLARLLCLRRRLLATASHTLTCTIPPPIRFGPVVFFLPPQCFTVLPWLWTRCAAVLPAIVTAISGASGNCARVRVHGVTALIAVIAQGEFACPVEAVMPHLEGALRALAEMMTLSMHAAKYQVGSCGEVGLPCRVGSWLPCVFRRWMQSVPLLCVLTTRSCRTTARLSVGFMA
jgi:hypothetical protein